MFTQQKFAGDLASGEAFEQHIAKLLRKLEQQCWYIKAEGNHPQFDFSCSHCRSSIECKSDYQATQTGNFCFELNLLQHSTAKWLIYGLREGEEQWSDYVYIFDLPLLRIWLRWHIANNSNAVRATRGGDQMHQLYLVHRKWVKQMPVVCINYASRQKPLGLDDYRMIELNKSR